jgi:hypothetical protein
LFLQAKACAPRLQLRRSAFFAFYRGKSDAVRSSVFGLRPSFGLRILLEVSFLSYFRSLLNHPRTRAPNPLPDNVPNATPAS